MAMRLTKSDHFDGRRFVNPTGDGGQPFSAVPRMLLEPRTPWPARADQPWRRPPGLDGAEAVVTFNLLGRWGQAPIAMGIGACPHDRPQ
jgi:hypothetical protein